MNTDISALIYLYRKVHRVRRTAYFSRFVNGCDRRNSQVLYSYELKKKPFVRVAHSNLFTNRNLFLLHLNTIQELIRNW